MKKLFFLYLLMSILQASRIEDEGFIKEINNLAIKEDKVLKQKIKILVQKNPKKVKTKIILRMLKSVTGELKNKKISNKKNYNFIKKKIRRDPRLLKKFVKMVRIYKKLNKKKKRKLFQHIYNGLHHSMDSITGVLDYLIKHFSENNNLVDTYLKPFSTLYALNGLKKNLNKKEEFRIESNHYNNMKEKYKAMNDLLKNDLEDIQHSVLQLDRVYNRIGQLNQTFNFRLDMKIDVLRQPM